MISAFRENPCNPFPTFFGLGSSSSSASDDIPEPNCISVLPSALTLVTYLLGVLFNFKICSN